MEAVPAMAPWKRRIILVTVTLVLAGAFCALMMNLPTDLKPSSDDQSEELDVKCKVELHLVKRHLEAMVEYKEWSDQLLAGALKYETALDRTRSVMDICFAMTRQSAVCLNLLEEMRLKNPKSCDDCYKIETALEELNNIVNATFLI